MKYTEDQLVGIVERILIGIAKDFGISSEELSMSVNQTYNEMIVETYEKTKQPVLRLVGGNDEG